MSSVEQACVLRVEPVARASAVAAAVAALIVGLEVGSENPRAWVTVAVVTALVGVGVSMLVDAAKSLRSRPEQDAAARVLPDRVGWRVGLGATVLAAAGVVVLLEVANAEDAIVYLPGLLLGVAIGQRRWAVVSRVASRSGPAVCWTVPGWAQRWHRAGGRLQRTRPSRAMAPPPKVRSGRPRPRRRWLRACLGVLLVCLAIPTWSLGTALDRPSSDPLSVRAVEWLRGHGGAGAVDRVEAWWYAHHQPKTGGKPAIPIAGPASASGSQNAPAAPAAPAAAAAAAATLRAVPALASPPLPGEGQWRAVVGSAARPAVAVTELRPDPVHTSLLAGLLRIDPAQVRLQLLAGTEQPGGSFPEQGQVPPTERDRLLAAFNAGFRLRESAGGYFEEGRTVAPLRDGAASFVISSTGSVAVGEWGRDVSMSPSVTAVRQNLSLIVDNGAPVDGLATNLNNRWGHTLGNRLFVWRSGLGITADGALVYAAGPGLSVPTLADVLVAAGSVRAMELDINTDWVGAFTYQTGTGGATGTKLLPGMFHDPSRYLHPQSRDFIAVLAPS